MQTSSAYRQWLLRHHLQSLEKARPWTATARQRESRTDPHVAVLSLRAAPRRTSGDTDGHGELAYCIHWQALAAFSEVDTVLNCNHVANFLNITRSGQAEDKVDHLLCFLAAMLCHQSACNATLAKLLSRVAARTRKLRGRQLIVYRRDTVSKSWEHAPCGSAPPKLSTGSRFHRPCKAADLEDTLGTAASHDTAVPSQAAHRSCRVPKLASRLRKPFSPHLPPAR